ncbi:unnamed protein product [Notodromas monacha]|uniref:Ig-like domain-containing protein n=1 Tax=Notodromas monacha TaxID=399045 RepID=A0A7R9BG85_9CRUS|nr:unnamed protein product [Notodromas monacha]CAG0914174.1 unnamed protein product [Notodromas monacha]
MKEKRQCGDEARFRTCNEMHCQPEGTLGFPGASANSFLRRSQRENNKTHSSFREDVISARKPLVRGLKDVALVAKEKLRLRCKSRGNPPPQISWFKDGSPITERRGIRIRAKKKRSTLTIRRVASEDAGLYECRASNVLGEAFATARVRVRPKPGPLTSPSVTPKPQTSTAVKLGSTAFPWPEQPCPISSFCLNGGSCIYYQWLGEFACQ